MPDGIRECTFVYECQGTKNTLLAKVPIPMPFTLDDYVGRLISVFNIPCFIESRLKEHVEQFVAAEVESFHAERSQHCLQRLGSSSLDLGQVARGWSRAYEEEVENLSHGMPCPVDDSAQQPRQLPELFHELIHSRALDVLLRLEHCYAHAMGELLSSRDLTMADMERRQTSEMETAISNLSATHGDDYINHLAQKHFEALERETSRWDAEVNKLRADQRNEYHEWLRRISSDEQQYLQKAQAFCDASARLSPDSAWAAARSIHESRLEESFTIHLGAQLKTTHNLRLLSADALDFCRHRVGSAPDPRRLQMALSLYSNSLSGLVLLVDDRLNCYAGIKREFAQVCQQSTDFHFPSLGEQFERIQVEVAAQCERRAASSQLSDGASLKSSGSDGSSFAAAAAATTTADKIAKLKKGDFYITRHSNLAEVHTVFHLVVDDESRLLGDISSRHPVILGLRNVLKVCFHYDVTTITVPLLLCHHMTEEMTIPWCLKRAELVFKCVKGFMVEMSSLAGSQSCTVQFLVPKGLSYETFTMISSMLPGIFRQSNPIMAK